MQFLLVLTVLAVAVAVVSAPLRSPRANEDEDDGDLAALEAAKEAKYAEIRDAELDFRTGKLSRDDWEGVDRQLRAEAVELLRHLDRAREEAQAPGRGQTTS